MEPLILIVDDEKSIRSFLRVSLETQGYKCIDSETGAMALTLAIANNPDIMVLDLGLPDMDGIEVIHKLRKISSIPIIIISARGHDREKIEALDAGADDYLTKPFSVPELLARIRVIIRHTIKNSIALEMENSVFEIKNMVMDFEKRRVWIGEEEIHLTPNEYRVLQLLAENRGKVLTHRFITEKVWGGLPEDDTKCLRVCMGSLRRKLQEDISQPKYIFTEIGVGYRFVDE